MNTLKTNTEGYGYKYTDLAGVHKYLETIKASYYQYIDTVDGVDYIMTVPTIDGKELPARRGCRVVGATLSGKSNPAQEQGSSLTYARRYSLLMAFGLATDDDDGESLSSYEVSRGPRNSEKMVVGKYATEGASEGFRDITDTQGEVRMASMTQKTTIEKLGGEFVVGMTVKEASDLIGKLIAEKNARNK